MTPPKRHIHDAFFKDVYDGARALDVLRLVLSPPELALFDWGTLKSEATSLVDESQRERRMDLALSVKLKGSGEDTRIFFLLEHKSRRDDDALVQLLGYLAGGHRRARGPIIPVLVYHGRERAWRGSLNFQDSLPGLTPELRRMFGKNILDFTCRLLNVRELDVPGSAAGLRTAPALLILQRIWELDAETMGRCFALGRSLPRKEREDLMTKTVNYARACDPSFTWKRLTEIEERVIRNEEDRVMFSMKDVAKEMMEKGVKKGVKKGFKKGVEKNSEKIALSMLADGFNAEVVCKHTGLSEEVVRKLSKARPKQ